MTVVRPILTNTLKQARRLRTALLKGGDEFVIGEKNGVKVLEGGGHSARGLGIAGANTNGILSLKNGEPFKQILKNAETGQTTVYNFATGNMVEINRAGNTLCKTVTDMTTGEQRHLTMVFDQATKKPMFVNMFQDGYHIEGFSQPKGKFIQSCNREYGSTRSETFGDWCKNMLQCFNTGKWDTWV